MRAPFDRFVDLYNGPSTGSPGTLRAGAVPARLVPDDAFIDVEDPLLQSLFYLTMDAEEPFGPSVANTILFVWEYDFGAADRVALTEGGPVTHQVMRVESRTWPTGENYWRAHLAPILTPAPSVCSINYAEEYEVRESDGTYITTLTRTGPKTWSDGSYTLTAEWGDHHDAECFSEWRLYLGEDWWNDGWNGDEPQLFSYMGITFPLKIVQPVP